MKLKRFTRVVAVLAMAAGSTAAMANTAEAATCSLGYLCLYDGTSYSGTLGQFGGNNPNMATIPKSGGGTWNDVASSAWNNGTSGMVVKLFKDQNYYTGGVTPLCIGKGYKVANLGTFGLNNAVSSNQWSVSC